MDAFNQGQPSYSTIKRFKVLDHDLSQEGGELTIDPLVPLEELASVDVQSLGEHASEG